jgi:NarL family two-component system response regulator LiaR
MNGESRIRIILVEDHNVVRQSLKKLLSEAADIEVVADTESGEDAIHLVEEYAPDVVLLDLILETGQVDGLDVLQRIVTTSPSTRVLVLSMYTDEHLVLSAIRGGAIGFLTKRGEPDEVFEAIRDAARGRHHMDPIILQKLIEHFRDDGTWDAQALDHLTPRERDLLPLIARGLTNAEIARHLMISPATVKTHVSNMLHKLGLPSRERISFLLAHQNAKPHVDSARRPGPA